MAEETVANQPPVSVAKFDCLIFEVLTQGPKKIKEIYQLALERQPQNCPDVPCVHRKNKTASKSREWQHDIQRHLSRIAINVDGLWQLKVNVSKESSAINIIEMPEGPPVVTDVGNTRTVEPTPPEVPTLTGPTYTGDPFIVTEDGHFMDVEELQKLPEKRFIVPNNFDEFYAWKPDYVLNWVKKRLNRFVVDDEVEDWVQDLYIHIRYLPQGSKHRLPGANGHLTGCQDVIETFDPIQQYGASERRFRNYINMILAHKFLTVQNKHRKNPICKPGTVQLGGEETETEHATGDEFVHANSAFLSNLTNRAAKQHDDRLYTNQFKRFVWDNDPSLCSVLDALEITGTIGEAAKHLGISDGEFTRYRNRLKQLGECFQNDTPVPKQRRPYKKRAKTGDTVIQPPSTTP
jgi:hypothetical protein